MLMKKLLLLLVAAVCCQLPAESATPSGQLLKRLKRLQRQGIMVGHQDDPVYGRTWKWEQGRSDVKDVCGDYPAVMGFELGSLELGKDKNLDGVPFDRMREEIISQHERGGISTLSWHPWNPVTGNNAWDPTGQAVTAVLPGGARHGLFDEWLGTVARFLGSLKTPEGRAVPVIFRPWHEMSGGWFWWGKGRCTPEEYVRLYRYTHDQLTKKYGLKNIVWAFSPNGGADDYLECYPGDRYVDLLGVDIYDFNNDDAQYVATLKRELSRLTRIGKEHKKLVALTETGKQRLATPDWFTHVLWPTLSQYPMCYVLFWRNAWDNEKELYVAYPGHPTAEDFKAFYRLPRTLFVNDIK